MNDRRQNGVSNFVFVSDEKLKGLGAVKVAISRIVFLFALNHTFNKW